MTQKMPALERSCLGCDSDITDRHRLAKFCDRRCHTLYVRKQNGKEANPYAPRPCLMCQESIDTPTKYNQLYCSPECKKQCKANYTNHWRSSNLEYCRQRDRERGATLQFKDYRMVTVYGGYKGQYQELYEQQDGTCAICETAAPLTGPGSLCVDHCHETGTIRGLLCHACNTTLGKFNDDPERFDRASRYLKRDWSSE